MDFCPVFEWINSTPTSTALREWHLLHPIFETIHLLGISLALGTILIVDLSLLGTALRRKRIPQVARDLAPWMWRGLALAFASGAVLFWSDAVTMYNHAFFWWKMALLLVAVSYHQTIHRTVVQSAPSAGLTRSKWTAAFSLLLWFGAGFARQSDRVLERVAASLLSLAEFFAPWERNSRIAMVVSDSGVHACAGHRSAGWHDFDGRLAAARRRPAA